MLMKQFQPLQTSVVLVGEVQRLSVMAETVSSALNQARTQQNEIRGKINSLAEDDRSIKLGTLKAEIDIASKELTKAKGAASELQRRLSNLESNAIGMGNLPPHHQTCILGF